MTSRLRDLNRMRRLLAVARGDDPADLVFRGGHVANVFSGRVERADVAVADGCIVAVDDDLGSGALREVDVSGRVLAPGLVDAHVHIESSLVTPQQFARAVVPRGTTTVVADPHEIANVHGLEGIRYMLDASEGSGLSVFVMASSCVPASPLGTSGAELDARTLLSLRDHPRVLGLAEVMNYPGAIQGEPSVLERLQAFAERPIDGHAPGVAGRALDAYVLAGPGSDHESTSAGEAEAKLQKGLFVFIREATNARNLEDLLPLLRPAQMRRIALCTDDRQPPDLLDEGGIDHMVRRVVASGVDPVEALRLATLNPCEYFGLRDRGAIAPGRRADLLVTEDLASLAITDVYVAGRNVRGEVRDGMDAAPPPPRFRLALADDAFHIPARGGSARVIGVVEDQIVTEALTLSPTCRDGRVVADPDRDVLLIAVLERHHGSGRVGQGLVKGMGLRRGAIAGSVAHDHHNVIVVGCDPASMRTAVARVVELGGGLVAAEHETALAELALPIGGLMSAEPIETVRSGLDAVIAAAHRLGSTLRDPFMAMSFLGLEVIPSLKITDRGLVDVEAFRPVGLWI